MTDQEHAKAIRQAARQLADAVNAATADGLTIEFSELDITVHGDKGQRVMYEPTITRITKIVG